MSHSYKKTPYCGDRKQKIMKRQANKIVRKSKEAYQNASYKKCFCSYNICDFKDVGCTFEKFWKTRIRQWKCWGYKYYPYPDKKEEYRKWYRYYKRK